MGSNLFASRGLFACGFLLWAAAAMAEQTQPQAQPQPQPAVQPPAFDLNAELTRVRGQGSVTPAVLPQGVNVPAGRCDQARATLGLDRRSTDPAQRLAAAKTLRACVEEQRVAAMVRVQEGTRSQGATVQALSSEIIVSAYSAPAAAAAEGERSAKAETDFLGMTFGIGIGFSHSRKERITEATVAADGTVRVTAREKQVPRVILEAHYFGLCTSRLDMCKEGSHGVGPFFGLAATNDVIEAFALGIMFGRKDPTAGERGGFSIGIGAVLDRKVKGLAKGFEEGKPLPTGETQVVFEQRSKWSPLLFFTRTF